MMILVEISPKAETNLAAQAVVRGIALEQFASKLLEDAASALPVGASKLTREEFHEMLRELADGSEALPKLPTSAFSRESIYEDHL